MTTLRLFTLSAHAALELALGLGLLVAPFVLGFTPAGMVVGVALGALITGLALSGATREPGGLPIAAHLAFDRALALAASAGSIALALQNDRVAATVLAIVALTQVALSYTTRYSAAA
jgi:hypothetical protein